MCAGSSCPAQSVAGSPSPTFSAPFRFDSFDHEAGVAAGKGGESGLSPPVAQSPTPTAATALPKGNNPTCLCVKSKLFLLIVLCYVVRNTCFVLPIATSTLFESNTYIIYLFSLLHYESRSIGHTYLTASAPSFCFLQVEVLEVPENVKNWSRK